MSASLLKSPSPRYAAERLAAIKAQFGYDIDHKRNVRRILARGVVENFDRIDAEVEEGLSMIRQVYICRLSASAFAPQRH